MQKQLIKQHVLIYTTPPRLMRSHFTPQMAGYTQGLKV